MTHRSGQEIHLKDVMLQDLLSRVTYKRAWTLIVGWDGDQPWLQWHLPARDSQTGNPVTYHGRKWRLSWYMLDAEIVQTAFMAALAAEEHEAREFFKYQGRAIFGPHLSLESLYARAEDVKLRRPEQGATP